MISLNTIKLIISKSIIPISFIICIIVCIVMIIQITSIQYDCKYRHSPSYSELINKVKINKDGSFVDIDGKLIAQSIYEYRSQFDYEYGDDNNYINIFNIHKPETPYKLNELKDIALYKLSTCDINLFSKMMTFVYVFNNDNYIKCINAYDESSKKFNDIDGKTTRDIIIKDVLKFGDSSVIDLKKSIETKIKNAKLDSSISQQMINNIIDTLNNMTDEQLFNLINIGIVE